MRSAATPSESDARAHAATLAPSGSIVVRQLGRVDYIATAEAMRRFTAARDATTPDEFWVLEHPPVYTVGQAGRAQHLPRASSIPVVRTDRGGQITYHGPGQAVVYLMVDLARRRLSVRELVRHIEAGVINLLAEHGVAASRRAGAPGVYVDGAKVAALDATRRHAFSEDMRDVCNRDALRWIDSADAGCMFGCSMLPSLFGFGKKAKCVAFVLDGARLAEAKRAGAAASGGPFVSTNDVLTSAFFNACDNRIGLMGLDCRGRVDGIASDVAGNYVTALVLDDATFASPGRIRAMLGNVPYETTERPFPSCAKWCAGMDRASAGMVTNWSSFAGDLVSIPDCELALHLPVKHPDAMMFDCAIPFASRPGETSVLCWTISTDEAG